MKKKRCFIILMLALIGCLGIGLLVGRYPISFSAMLSLLGFKIHGQPIPAEMPTDVSVICSVRLPRVLMVALVGAALSVSGTVFQGLFRNPLVSPDILGVSSGASFGAGLAILIFGGSVFSIQVSAFVWGLLAVGAAYRIGNRGKYTVTTLVLAGVIVSAVFTAGLSFLKYIADPYEELPAIIFWTMGGFANVIWADISRSFPFIIIGLAIIFVFRWRLNILALGEEEALNLGVEVKKAYPAYIVLATLIVASSISVCGTIGWVGLVVPHMARMISGPDHGTLVPMSMLIGAIFMIIMDTLARSISGAEIPIGIMTSLIGAPFLAYLLIKQQRDDWT